ncbi:alpha/beta fold hydrolase [Streptomyces albidoflavus]|uniref:alpha/beta fold hydrolase n=1 Tax=Streptomyces albidoflavus TaxID=1886 RepID=UPI00101E6F0C|nr:alpha/beta hydrolase [Streptomyces albidoflavus]RZE89821.1 alpha/beta hydrolase [Streptomyces albidoflavus]RZE91502.1 alpha/beta hydrolase [Streptomyces albidoflavus]
MSGASSRSSRSPGESRLPVHATVWDDRPNSGGSGSRWPVVLVHGILTWGTDPRYGFAAQRPLAARHRLLLMDRRGYGRSPDIARSDWAVDAEDIVELLGTGAHLVGHAYGGVGALAAAVRRPDLVRSLTLIQPGALRPAARHPVVAEALARARAATAALPPDLTPADFLRGATESVGMETPEATPERLRAAATTMAELPCWDAEIDLGPLARAAFPQLLVSGDWEGAPEPYRTYAGLPLIACAEEIAEATGAAHLVVPGHYPHTQQPERVNAALEHLWEAADQG